MIPLNIIQIWHSSDVPSNISNIIETIKNTNPEFRHYLFDNDQSLQFIKSHFNNEIAEAYNALIPNSYKSDLTRLCFLYINGGVYLDSKFEPVNNFQFKTLIDKNHFALDTPSDNGISGGLIVVEPKHPDLLIGINKIIDNVKNKFYGSSSLEVTGPNLLKKIIHKDIDLEFIHDKVKNIRGYTYNNQLILKEYAQYRADIRKYGDVYYDQWYEKKIYKQLIPKNIYFTFKNNNLSKPINNIIENNKKICPDYTFNFFDDKMCEDFILNNFSSNTYKAYMKINPKLGAMKADFWRYCILYQLGGIYLDIKISLIKNLDTIIKPLDKCIFMPPNLDGIVRKKNNIPVYEQWILLFAPKHIYLKKMIETMTENILNEYEPPCDILSYEGCSATKHKVLHITGPDAFAKVINSCPQEHTICDIKFAHYNEKAKNTLYSQQRILHYSNITDNIYLP